MGAELEAACAQPCDPLPIDRILRQGQVPCGAKAVALLDLSHRFHPLESPRAFDVVGEHDAALGAVRPEPDVPFVARAVQLQPLPHPTAPELDQRALTWPAWKLQRRTRADRGRVQA